MATLMGDTTSSDVWMRGLRDSDAAVWSKGSVKQSPDMDAAYAAVHGGGGQPFPDHQPSTLPHGYTHPHSHSRSQQWAEAGGAMPGALGGNSSREGSPKLKRTGSVKVAGAVEADVDLRAVTLCQKPSALRTQEDIKFIQTYMCSLSYFFSLWPAPLQWELARLLSVHILARREVALSRGRPLDRVYFVVQGRLDVRLPVPTLGGGREERTLAVLTRGHTVGEAVLLGTQAQHATVVVSSSSAMLLSLSRPDFSRAFKEVLDVRQADRLMYLRLHPLMEGLPLPDLEAASEVLGLAFFPPGTKLWPLEEKERCLYFLAEGQAKVKRAGGAGAAVGAGGHEGGTGAATGVDGSATAAAGPSMYDRSTVSILGPGDIFGLPSSDQALTLQLQQSCLAAFASAAAAVGLAGSLGTANTGTQAVTTGISAASLLTAAAAACGSSPATTEPSFSPTGTATQALAAGVGSCGGAAIPPAAASVHGVHGGHMTAHSTLHGGMAGHSSLGGGRERDGSGGVMIESFTSVKVYTVRYCDYLRLPAAVQRVLHAANAFRWSYYEGRIVGLARIENKRRDARREQLLRNANNAALQRHRGDSAGGVLARSDAAYSALQLGERDKVLLGRVPLHSAGMVGRPGTGAVRAEGDVACGVDGLAWQAVPARRAVQAVDTAQRERARLGGPLEGRPAAGVEDDPNVGMPAWALPGGGGGGGGTGRLAGLASTNDVGSGAAALEATLKAGAAATAATVGGAMRQRPGTADGSVLGSTMGSGPGAPASAPPGLHPLLYRSANAKALLAVQAGQLSRVLAAERQQFAANRRPVLHPADEYGDVYYEGEGADSEDAPWAMSYSGSDTADSPRRRGHHHSQHVAPLTTQYLTCRAEPGQPHDPHASLHPTLNLLPPTSHAFPRVQSYRTGRQSDRATTASTQFQGRGGHVVPAPPDAVVQTEEPRTLVAPQTVRQRHVLLFQNAQAMAAAASSSRSWIKPARQPRPSYSRVHRASQPGSGRSGPSSGRVSDGGASAASDPQLPPPRNAAGGLPMPASRFGHPASGGAMSTSYDAGGGPTSARGPSGGRRPLRPDDRLSRYGSTGRVSSAGGGGAGGEGGAPSGIVLISSDLPSPNTAFGRPGVAAPSGGLQPPASPELSFSHLGIRDDDEDDEGDEGDSGDGGSSSGSGGSSGGAIPLDELGGGGGGALELDDALPLARVPARLLGKAGARAGAGACGAGPRVRPITEGPGSAGAKAGPAGLQPLLPLPQLPSAAVQNQQSSRSLGAQQQQQQAFSGSNPYGHGSVGTPQLKVSAAPSLASSSPPSSRMHLMGADPSATPTASAVAVTGADGGSSGSGGLNFTMRRRGGVGGEAGSTAPAASLGGAGAANGALVTVPAAAPSPPPVASPLPQGGTPGRNAAALQPAGRPAGSGPGSSAVGSGSSAQRAMDAEFPQDLDERSLHHHGHHGHSTHTQQQAPSSAGVAAASTVGGSTSTGGAGQTRGSASASSLQAPTQFADHVGAFAAGGSSGGQGLGQSQGPVPVGLPPAVALGYESLDPFAWAALAAQVGPSLRSPFSQENLLPKPQWQG